MIKIDLEKEGALYVFSYTGDYIPPKFDLSTIRWFTKYNYGPYLNKTKQQTLNELVVFARNNMRRDINYIICDQDGTPCWRGRMVIEEWLL